MGMREDCRHYESRTYASGEVVRMCRLDLAPEAPWRCPENCVAFERRGFDAGWTIGSLTQSQKPAEPPPVLDESVAGLLDQAEDIINTVGDEILSEVKAEREQAEKPKPWNRFRRKRK
ncbi:MAG: hypothetical protein QOJ09_1326 [Actinomycetota bacterium]|jgi:hypothetical protein|nr:hypothetical protein [Actinomycetota bacterium]